MLIASGRGTPEHFEPPQQIPIAFELDKVSALCKTSVKLISKLYCTVLLTLVVMVPQSILNPTTNPRSVYELDQQNALCKTSRTY